MRRGRIAVGAAVGAIAAAIGAPLHVLAASTSCDAPVPTVPEVPGGPLLIVAAGLAVMGGLVVVRRRGGVPPAAVSTLLVVLLAGAVLGMVVAAAATNCSPSNPGGVLGVSSGTTTPLTGADIPWITGAVLVSLGIITMLVALPRRRARARRSSE